MEFKKRRDAGEKQEQVQRRRVLAEAFDLGGEVAYRSGPGPVCTTTVKRRCVG